MISLEKLQLMFNALLGRILIFILYVISLLPFWALYILSDIIFFMLYHVAKYRRQVVQTNLSKSFPTKTALELHSIERKYYKYLADLIMESVKIISISKKSAQKHFKYTNPELLDAYYAQGESVLAAAGHYGNWEMANVLPLSSKLINLVIYKPLANPVLETFLQGIRSRYGAVMVPMKLALRKMAEYRKQITLSVFVSDQTPHFHEAHYFTTFLNQPTAIFLGIEKVAKLTGSPVIFCDVQVVKRGYYTCTFIPLIEKPKETQDYEITEAHVRYLEKMINERPEYWLWSHKRWKFNQEGFINT